jgi:drug/metabolite transporter (DMT)-like permease
MPKSEKVIAYLAVAAFCLLTSLRDVISEDLFKDRLYEASPVFVLFVYSIETQLLAGIALFATRRRELQNLTLDVWKDLGWLNFFTLSAFLSYFLAIASPLGASLNSFIDYGIGPIFTAVVAIVVAGERVGSTFVITVAISILGIILLAEPRVQVTGLSLAWLAGSLFSLLSSLSTAFFRVYFRILLNKGLSKSAMMFLRLIATSSVLGITLALKPDLFRLDLLGSAIILGAVGFTLPLFLVLAILQRIALGNYAMLLFCVPVTTYLLSALFGFGRFYATDLIAAGLIFGSVGLHEFRSDVHSRT